MPFAGAVTEHALGAHVCAVKVPFVQDVRGPVTLYPELQANEQLLPEARLVGQVPRKPFAGAVTVHELPLICIPRMRSCWRGRWKERYAHTIFSELAILELQKRDGRMTRGSSMLRDGSTRSSVPG